MAFVFQQNSVLLSSTAGPNGIQFRSLQLLGPNGTQFRSLRPLGLNRTRSVPVGRVPMEPASVPLDGVSQRNSVPPGQLHHNGTRLCSPGRPVLNGTQFRSRAAGSQRNPVLFPVGRFSTERSDIGEVNKL